MVDGGIVVSELLSAIISTKIAWWCFQRSFSRSLMDFQDRYSSWIGFQCFLTRFGRAGLAWLIIVLIRFQFCYFFMLLILFQRMSMLIHLLNTPNYTEQALWRFISILEDSGSGYFSASSMDLSLFGCLFWFVKKINFILNFFFKKWFFS